MLVNHVDFLLTFKCPAECQHCSYELRKFLQPIYPYSLAPKECY